MKRLLRFANSAALLLLAVLSTFSAVAEVPQKAARVYAETLAAYRSGDYATAYSGFLMLARQGNSHAQFYLGYMYDSGKGVVRNYAEAVKWYRRAAEQGDVDAQFNLGLMY
ncbi:MAG: sel1 repeat family protein [Alphaproteobacteria bacterium]|nr:sel1 repeat family protein [Alphaproteobacteria bacterium]